MNYAVIENGAVTNVIWLSDAAANEFPSAIRLGDRPVIIGDSYVDGHFRRDGAEVLTGEEELSKALLEIAALDAALLDAEYQNLIGGLEE